MHHFRFNTPVVSLEILAKTSIIICVIHKPVEYKTMLNVFKQRNDTILVFLLICNGIEIQSYCHHP